MTCDQARRLLYLSRPGEIEEEEREALSRHLATCTACSDEREKVRLSELRLEQLRLSPPLVRSPERLTRAILARVAASSNAPRATRAGLLLDRLAGLLDIPLLRYGAAAFITLTLTLFVAQEMTILKNVSALQNRLSGIQRPSMHLAYAVDLESIRTFRESRTVEELLNIQIPTSAGERIFMPQQTALALHRLLLGRELHEPVPSRTLPLLDSLLAGLRKEGALKLLFTTKGDSQ
jgi:hypothetical protein